MVGEIIFALILICEFVFQVKQGYNYQISWITFTSAAVFIAIVLGLTFWYLNSLNKQVEGIFCDARLMALHYAAFFVATLCDVIVLTLQTINTRLVKDGNLDRATSSRLDIGVDVFTLVQQIVWFIC